MTDISFQPPWQTEGLGSDANSFHFIKVKETHCFWHTWIVEQHATCHHQGLAPASFLQPSLKVCVCGGGWWWEEGCQLGVALVTQLRNEAWGRVVRWWRQGSESKGE